MESSESDGFHGFDIHESSEHQVNDENENHEEDDHENQSEDENGDSGDATKSKIWKHFTEFVDTNGQKYAKCRYSPCTA